MKFELPPERPLPGAEWMVERILVESSSVDAQRSRGRAYWVSGLVAAAVVITVAVIGWAAIFPSGQTQIGAPPAASTTPTGPVRSPITSPSRSPAESSPTAASPTSRPPSAQPTTTSRNPSSPTATAVPNRTPAATPPSSQSQETPTGSTEKPNPTVTPEPPLATTVPIGVRVQAPYLNLTASGTMTGGDVYAILVETCVRSLPPDTSDGLRLTKRSWTLSTSEGTVTTEATISNPISLPTTYPDEGIYLVGECATGWIPFGVGPDTRVTGIAYRDAFGANVTWNPNT